MEISAKFVGYMVRLFHNSSPNICGVAPINYIDVAHCITQKKVFDSTDTFEERGGITGMGEALGRGMVLISSIWDGSRARCSRLTVHILPLQMPLHQEQP